MATPDINKAYQWAINTCNTPNVGYSMNTSWREGRTINGVTYYDCSSFIYYALIAGDFPLTRVAAFTTRDMIPVLLNLGFTEKPVSGEWKAGDILWRTGHTEMVYLGGQGQGRTMGAHTDELPLDDQVSIYPQTSYASEWQRLFRYGNGATGGNTTAQNGIVYDQDVTLNANGFTRAYTVTYNYNGSGAANTTATAIYTFNGWKKASASYSGTLVAKSSTWYDNVLYGITPGTTYNISVKGSSFTAGTAKTYTVRIYNFSTGATKYELARFNFSTGKNCTV